MEKGGRKLTMQKQSKHDLTDEWFPSGLAMKHETISNHPCNLDPFSSFEPHKHVQYKNVTCSAHFQTTHSPAPAPATIFNTWFFQEKSWRPKNISCAPAMAPAVTFEVHQARLNFPRFVLGLHPATQSDNSIIVSLLKKLRNWIVKTFHPKRHHYHSFMAYSLLRVSNQRTGGGPSCRTWSILRWSPKPGFPKPVPGGQEPDCWVQSPRGLKGSGQGASAFISIFHAINESEPSKVFLGLVGLLAVLLIRHLLLLPHLLSGWLLSHYYVNCIESLYQCILCQWLLEPHDNCAIDSTALYINSFRLLLCLWLGWFVSHFIERWPTQTKHACGRWVSQEGSIVAMAAVDILGHINVEIKFAF